MWFFRIIAILSLILSILWMTDTPGYEPVLTTITSLGSLISLFILKTNKPTKIESNIDFQSVVKYLVIGVMVAINIAIVAFIAPILFGAGGSLAANLFAPTPIPPMPTPSPTWERLIQTENTIYQIETGPDGMVYVGSRSGIYKSKNNGNNFTLVNNGFLVNNYSEVNRVRYFAIDSSNPRKVIANSEEGIWITTDDGVTWREIQMDLSITDMLRFTVGFSDDGIIVIPGNNRVYKEKLASPYYYFENTEVVVFCNYMEVHISQEIILCSGGGKILSSNNNGETWTELLETSVEQMDISPFDSEVIYVATGKSIIRSLNGGVNWQDISADLINSEIVGVVADPLNPRIVYIAKTSRSTSKKDGGIYRYMESQNKWEYLGGPQEPTSLAISYNNPNIIFIGTSYEGIWRLTIP